MEQDRIVAIRRELHRYAEPAWKEIRTSARIAQWLEELGCTDIRVGPDAVDTDSVIPAVRPSQQEQEAACAWAVAQGADPKWVERTRGWPGVVAVIDTGRPGPTVAYRFDIDALPYPESNSPDHRAVREGYVSITDAVHACGHDGHTAIGIGLADLLLRHKDELRGQFRLLFQPAEESYCGALSMVNKGHLQGVGHFVSLHIGISGDNRPLPSGTMACGCDDFLGYGQQNVTFIGRAAHPCGASQEGRNAILAACTATLGLHAIAPHEDGLMRINVGRISGGVATNTIAPQARIELEFRGETQDVMEYARQRVEDVLEGAARTHGVTLDIEDMGVTPAAKSDPAMLDVVERASAAVPWFQKLYRYGNVGGSDDATDMMTAVQKQGGIATYMGLGADATAAIHNEAFDFDETVLPAGAALCLQIALQLAGHQ